MGNALVVFKVFTEEPEQMEEIEGKLREITIGKFQELKREPIAFGIEAIKVGYIVPDKTDGIMPKLEEEMNNIPGVKQVEMAGLTLI